MNVELIVSDLDTYYAELVREGISDYAFYSALAKYGLKLRQNQEILNGLISDLLSESVTLQSSYLAKAKDYIKLAKLFGTDIVGICTRLYPEYSALDLPIPTAIEEVRKFIARSEQELLKRDLSYFTIEYGEVLRKIFENPNDKSLISTKHLEYNLSEVSSLYKYDSRICIAPTERNKLSVIGADLASLWTDYENRRNEEVWWAHYQIDRISSGFYGKFYPTIYPGKLQDETNDIDQIYEYEIKKVSRGEKPLFLLRKNFLTYASRLHSHIIPRLKFTTVVTENINSNHEYMNGQLHLYDNKHRIIGTVPLSIADKLRMLFECFYFDFKNFGKTIFVSSEILECFNEKAKEKHTWSYVSKMIPKLKSKFKENEQVAKLIRFEYLQSKDGYKFLIKNGS